MGERRKAAATPTPINGNGFDSSGNGCGYSVDQIEEIVRTGAPAGGNRSDLFHMIVGHFVGCGWTAEQILAHLEQYPRGIGERYLCENRLAGEIDRSCRKYGAAALPLSDDGKGWTNGGWETKAPQPEALEQDDPELQDDSDEELLDEERPPQELDDPELRDDPPQEPELEKLRPDDDADLDDDDLDNDPDDELGDEPEEVGMAVNDLCAAVFEPPNYVVPGYVVEGLTLFAGKPKVGKSWLMLHAGMAVARGGFTLGDTHCASGDVLYAALEDNKRRLQRRALKLLDGQSAPKRIRILSAGEIPRLSEGGTAMIRAWIEQVPDPKLVVIDVLAKVRDLRRRDQGLYDSDYAAMEELKKIADEYGIAVVVIHHLRKMDADDPLDQVSGTTGLAGSADTVLVLNRTSSGTTLLGRGRDIEDIDQAVLFDRGTCTWAVLGDASRVRYTGERAAILAALRDASGPVALADIAATAGLKTENTRKLLAKLVRDGAVSRVNRGQYELVPDSTE